MKEERAAKLEAELEKRNKGKAGSKAGQNVASTSWVVAGKHSASGKPLVVVEPHTDPYDLTQYKMTQFEILGESLTGSTFLGVPGLVNGRTARAAWG